MLDPSLVVSLLSASFRRRLVVVFLALACLASTAWCGTYRLGRGDVLRIEVAEEPTLTGSYTISEEGTILYPLLGALPLAGLSVPEAANLIRSRLATDYLKAPQVALYVAEYKSQQVSVLGDVPHPGLYPLAANSSPVSVLTDAGVKLGSDKGTVIIWKAAQGTPSALTNITIILEQLLQREKNQIPYEMEDGDQMLVRLESKQRIIVSGKVKKPGVIPYEPGMTAMEAISKAGGLADFGNLKSIRVVREGPQGSDLIKVDLRDVEKGDRSKDVMLAPGDIVVVPRGWL